MNTEQGTEEVKSFYPASRNSKPLLLCKKPVSGEWAVVSMYPQFANSSIRDFVNRQW